MIPFVRHFVNVICPFKAGCCQINAVDHLVSAEGDAMTFNLILNEHTGPDDEKIFSKQVDELMATLSPFGLYS